LQDAVRERLIADVPVGAFLSGGVDSSLVVALMSKISGRPVTTVSMGFEEEKFSELPHARQVAELYKCDHHEHVLRPDAADLLPRLTFHYGEPFADNSALATYYVAQVARQYATVVLTGDGGDENFAGYLGIKAVAAASAMRYLPGMKGGQLAALLRYLNQRGVKAVRQARWVAEMGQGKHGNYVFDPVAVRTFRSRQEILGPLLCEQAGDYDSDHLYRELWDEAGAVDWVDRAMYVDMMAYLPNDLLVKTDVATMAHGLEARAPLLDRRLIELTCRIPPQLKLAGYETKFLLKRLSERYLPKEFLYRRKQGFAVPIAHWFRGELGEILEPLLLSPTADRGYLRPNGVRRLIAEHRSGQADHGQRLWMMVMLELWFRMFIDKELAPGDCLTSFA
jgi:asparagine synthase (glutamine-hydrolysing)